MRISEFGCHIEFKLVVPRNHGISNFNHFCATLFKFLLQKQRLKRSIKLFSYILKKHPSSETDSVFKGTKKIFVSEFDHIDVIWAHCRIFSHIFDETISL